MVRNILKVIGILCFFVATVPQMNAYSAEDNKLETGLMSDFFAYAFETALVIVPVKEYIDESKFIDPVRNKIRIEVYYNLTRFSPSPEIGSLLEKKGEDKKTAESDIMERYKKAYPRSKLWETTEKANIKLDPALLEILLVESLSSVFSGQAAGKDEALRKRLTDTFHDGTSSGRVKDLDFQIFVSGFFDDEDKMPLAVARLSVKDEKGVFKGKKLLLLERTDGIWRISR